MKNPPEGLIEYLKNLFESLPTVQAFILVNRMTRILSLKKLPTIILFYDNQNGYNKDNEVITKSFEKYFQNVNYIIDLLSFDMNNEFTNEIVEGTERMGIEIIETKAST